MDEQKSTSRLASWWSRYISFVEGYTTVSSSVEYSEITYLRDRLFTKFITYLFPVCLIALVPGVFMGVSTGHYFIVAVDLGTLLLIAVVVLNKGLKLIVRKVFVLFMLYCLSIVLIITLGSMGPGIIYLLMLSVLTALLFQSSMAYWSVGVNTLVCLSIGIVVHLGVSSTPLLLQYTVGTWIAVSSNIIFLSLLCVVLISYTLNRLEDTIKKELFLKTSWPL
jgi:hypothetical protein